MLEIQFPFCVYVCMTLNFKSLLLSLHSCLCSITSENHINDNNLFLLNRHHFFLPMLLEMRVHEKKR